MKQIMAVSREGARNDSRPCDEGLVLGHDPVHIEGLWDMLQNLLG